MTRTLSEWLKENDLAEFEALFVENQVDLRALEVLTESDLKELGLSFGPRKRILAAIGKLKAPEPVPAGPPAAAVSTAERRQLTVMFCDLVESTALSALLDPEELNALIITYRKTCGDVVLRYGGHVAQYLGDGLMIYFGWPIAHEDAAERSVRAALEIVEVIKGIRAAKALAVRVGVATGPVVVGETLRGGAGEAGLAVGETPNLAARVQALAGPGEVVIAASTRRLLGNAFTLVDLGLHSLKGIAQSVQLWRVKEIRRTEGRFKAAHGGVDVSPLIGRDEETTLLLRRWEQARGGEGQVVLIGGQAGIGKSRLTQGLRDAITEPHAALHYQCSPYHTNSALHPFIEQLELTSGFTRDDDAERRLEKLEAALAVAGADVAETAPFFATLLSLPADRYPPLSLSPRKQKEKTLEAFAAQVKALASSGLVLMVVEDIHWVDPTSQELLDLLVSTLVRLPVLLVVTHRLEYAPSWTGQPGVTALTLNRLGRQQGAKLVDTVTKGTALPPEVLDEILARADGVPLFVEELTRSVLESGMLREQGGRYVLQGTITALAIPASLRDSLMARLDRLGPAKELAQIGACIGREFSYELIERVSGRRRDLLEASLEKLVDAGLATRNDAPSAAVYTFKHALIQDAAYESLLKSRRAELHARIAYVLEHDFSDTVTKAPEWLAHHRTQAGDLAEAIPLWRKAGILAVERVALKEGVAHLLKGLSLVERQPFSPERDSLELSIREPLNAAWTGLQGWAASEVGENATAALRLAESQGNRRSLLLAMWWVWTSTITQGRIADSATWVDRLLAQGGEGDDIDIPIFAHATAMVQHFLDGRLLKSREHAEKALALYNPRHAQRWIQITGHDLRTFVEVYACQLLWMLGYPEQAANLCAQSRAHAHSDGHAFNLVWALTFSSYVFAYRREPELFLERVAEADRLAREHGLTFIYEVSVPQARGIAELQKGRHREAVALLREGIARWTRTGGNVRIPLVKSALAEALALDGDVPAALESIQECIDQIDHPSGQERLWLPEVLRCKGWILLRQGRQEEAEGLLRASIECAREQQARSWELRSALTLARLLAGRGERDAARELLAPVYGWFTEGTETKDLLEAGMLLGELTSVAGRSGAA
jgi:class 3 adenylate cyclase/tetratricopeptide (TPR) repeat protein